MSELERTGGELGRGEVEADGHLLWDESCVSLFPGEIRSPPQSFQPSSQAGPQGVDSHLGRTQARELQKSRCQPLPASLQMGSLRLAAEKGSVPATRNGIKEPSRERSKESRILYPRATSPAHR